LQPLKNIRVLALENYYAGNIGSLIFTRFGAEVIKIESPEGDNLRDVGPMRHKDGRKRGISELRTMGGKKSLPLNMDSAEGLEILFALVKTADVVWTNMKPSSLIKLGITYESLKSRRPDIIYTTLSGFGHNDVVSQGPYGNWTAFDLIAQGLAGLQYRADGPAGEPGNNGLPLGDQVTATMAVLGTVMALFRRTREQGPQRVDVAMHDTMLMLNELPLGLLGFTGNVPPRGRSGTSAPYGAYKTKDGYVNIAVGGDPIWRRLTAAMGRPDLTTDPRFATSRGRVAHIDELDVILQAWTSDRTAMEVVAVLEPATVPCAPVYTLPQVLESPQVRARNMLVTIDDPIAGQAQIIGNPIKMSGNDDGFAAPPPVLGADSAALLHEIGFDDERIHALAARGVIRLPVKPPAD